MAVADQRKQDKQLNLGAQKLIAERQAQSKEQRFAMAEILLQSTKDPKQDLRYENQFSPVKNEKQMQDRLTLNRTYVEFQTKYHNPDEDKNVQQFKEYLNILNNGKHTSPIKQTMNKQDDSSIVYILQDQQNKRNQGEQRQSKNQEPSPKAKSQFSNGYMLFDNQQGKQVIQIVENQSRSVVQNPQKLIGLSLPGHKQLITQEQIDLIKIKQMMQQNNTESERHGKEYKNEFDKGLSSIPSNKRNNNLTSPQKQAFIKIDSMNNTLYFTPIQKPTIINLNKQKDDQYHTTQQTSLQSAAIQQLFGDTPQKYSFADSTVYFEKQNRNQVVSKKIMNDFNFIDNRPRGQSPTHAAVNLSLQGTKLIKNEQKNTYKKGEDYKLTPLQSSDKHRKSQLGHRQENILK